MVSPRTIPKSLRDLPQWILWKNETRVDRKVISKIPYGIGKTKASTMDPSTWNTYQNVYSEFVTSPVEFDGIGFVFSFYDEFTGVDLDGCRNPENGDLANWATKATRAFNTYTEVSPSGTGLKMFCRGLFPLDKGRNKALDFPPMVEGKRPGIEIYNVGRYFAVTGQGMVGFPTEPQDCTKMMAALAGHYFPKPKPPTPAPRPNTAPTKNGLDIADRARRYISKCPPSVSGQGGHNAAFTAACQLVIGWDLDRDTAFVLLSEWNAKCDPPWSEKELWHKIDSAGKLPDERGGLINK